MKKSIKLAAVAAFIATPALAENSITNLENPLYIPSAGEVYSKTAVGLMSRLVDNTTPMVQQGAANTWQFPIWRLYEDLGVGITDRLSVRGSVGWTQNNDGNRGGLSEGRLGVNYRVFDGSRTAGINWDVYADAFLGGLDPMRATLGVQKVMTSMPPIAFSYDNYSNGQYGVWVGTQVGKTWDKFTGAAYGEVQRTFGNDNNRISIDPTLNAMLAGGMLPGHFYVDTASTWAFGVGVKGNYQFNDKWSMGGSLTFRRYANEKLDAIHITAPAPVLVGLAPVMNGFLGNMEDGWDDWTLGLSGAYQFTRTVQGALYGDYTVSHANVNSQDGSQRKFEFGARLNLRF